MNVGSWGRLGAPAHDVRPLTERAGLRLPLSPGATGLAYGMGRSYGDVCLNPGGTLWPTRFLDRFIAFDPVSGELACEAGVLLRDIQRCLVPRGWMLPVTPGTEFVTVGGAIANDVHGKNHHAFGTFGDHVLGLTLLRTDGQSIECGPDRETPWFRATVGGLGLTGVITQARLRLRPVAGPWIDTQVIPYRSLDEFFALADASEAGWEHTVSWVDCTGGAGVRGLFMRGRMSEAREPAPRERRSLRVPVTPPVSTVNALSVRLLNCAYFQRNLRRRGTQREHYARFFYPLDHVLDWNRLYGRRGFYQYQCALPRAERAAGIQALLSEIARSGEGSFLSVLKTFGERAPAGLLSFPRPGVTLALDFPNRGATTASLFARLDAIVRSAGGRLYPAKDARMSAAMFAAGGLPLADFGAFRDPGIRSAFARRVFDA